MTQAAQFTGYLVGAKGNTGRGIRTISQNSDYTIKIILTDGTIFTTSPIPGFTSVDLDENFDLVVTKTDGTEITVETGLGEYNTTLSGYKTDAENAATSAGNSKDAASGSATTATQQATLARSYAKGDTSSRTGEATDNAEYFKGQASESATSASSSASTAEAQALVSEGYAQGTQVSTPVTSDSPYYHNNSKYFSELASASDTSAASSASSANTDALKAEGYAVGKQNGTTQTSGTYYHNNAQYYNSQATQAASISATQATASGTQALKSEGFAVGEQSGTPVTSGSDYYENNAKYYAGEAADSATAAAASAASIDPDTLAKIDGYYDTLGAGTAEQLTSNIYEEDSVPYNFRTSGGSIDIGDRETDMLVGGTIVWNQFIQPPSVDQSLNAAGVHITDHRNGSFTFYTDEGGATAQKYCFVGQQLANDPVKKDHVFAILGLESSSSAQTWRVSDQYNGVLEVGVGKSAGVVKATGNGRLDARLIIANGAVITTPITITPQYFDLTKMFGSTIADYIYSLEQANAGAGVAWFKKLFPKPYYAYNAGELMSVNASSHDMVGFNQFDASDSSNWENWYIGSGVIQSGTYFKSAVIPCVPNTKYYACKELGSRLFLASFPTYPSVGDTATAYQGNNIGKETNLTTGENDHYLVVWFYNQNADGTNYQAIADTLNINISWDGERDGEYEAYVKHEYPLDSSLTLRGIPKLDANNNLYYDGDTYESDGTVTRKYGIVDLGECTWTQEGQHVKATIDDIKLAPSASTQPNTICTKFILHPQNGAQQDDLSVLNWFHGVLWWTYGTKTAQEAKNAMSGVYLVYEKATSTTETADPYTNPQIVNDFGTEEYVDYAVSQGDRDVSIPVGHYTQYMANLKAKLEMSPNSPEGAGDYIVRQTNGENEYVTLASNATIQDIIARLEALENAES